MNGRTRAETLTCSLVQLLTALVSFSSLYSHVHCHLLTPGHRLLFGLLEKPLNLISSPFFFTPTAIAQN